MWRYQGSWKSASEVCEKICWLSHLSKSINQVIDWNRSTVHQRANHMLRIEFRRSVLSFFFFFFIPVFIAQSWFNHVEVFSIRLTDFCKLLKTLPWQLSSRFVGKNLFNVDHDLNRLVQHPDQEEILIMWLYLVRGSDRVELKFLFAIFHLAVIQPDAQLSRCSFQLFPTG